jgi:hypothetical protein
MTRLALALAITLGMSARVLAQEDEPSEEPDVEEPADRPASEVIAEPIAEAEEEAPAQPAHIESPTQRPPSGDLGAQIRQRNDVASIHRAFGIATWGAMLVTSVLGFLQYYNLYGMFASREDTPCVRGGAIFGQEACWGTPWPHLIGAITTTALYSTTFILSFTMPDPLGAGTSSADLRLHKDLRWVHLGGMIAQMLFGLAIGNNWFGLDRANDYEAQQVLASVHQLIGYTTLGVLTAAGLVMVF